MRSGKTVINSLLVVVVVVVVQTVCPLKHFQLKEIIFFYNLAEKITFNSNTDILLKMQNKFLLKFIASSVNKLSSRQTNIILNWKKTINILLLGCTYNVELKQLTRNIKFFSYYTGLSKYYWKSLKTFFPINFSVAVNIVNIVNIKWYT